jgi:cation:H+ antiporter
LVEAVRRLSGIEGTQTKLGLTVVGFATAFELIVLAAAAGRRGMPETVLASVVGSFAYNVTMTLGAGALARPLQVLAADQLRLPLLALLGALVAVLALARPTGRLSRPAGALLLAAYPPSSPWSLPASGVAVAGCGCQPSTNSDSATA